jgi:Tfp pilus assembly protein PilW
MPRKTPNKKRGGTLIELMTAVCLSIIVLAGCLGILFSGTASWANGLGKSNSQSDAEMAVRTISNLLEPAMSVSVSSDGNTLTYELPATDTNGNYIVPLTWDGVNRQITANHNQITLVDGNSERVLINSLIYTDPLANNAPYKVFTPIVASVTSEVTIEIATQYHGYKAAVTQNRAEATINFRNVSALSTRGG